jgi:glutamate-1-semialdehyde 2,1-aminomutase
VFDRRGLPMCVTGSGSLMTIHPVRGPVRSVADLAAGDDRFRELLFFDSLEAGYFFARRGFIALSIEVTDDDLEGFVDHVDRWAARVAAWRGA